MFCLLSYQSLRIAVLTYSIVQWEQLILIKWNTYTGKLSLLSFVTWRILKIRKGHQSSYFDCDKLVIQFNCLCEGTVAVIHLIVNFNNISLSTRLFVTQLLLINNRFDYSESRVVLTLIRPCNWNAHPLFNVDSSRLNTILSTFSYCTVFAISTLLSWYFESSQFHAEKWKIKRVNIGFHKGSYAQSPRGPLFSHAPHRPRRLFSVRSLILSKLAQNK